MAINQHGDQFDALLKIWQGDQCNIQKIKDLVTYLQAHKQGQHQEVILQAGIKIA